MSLVLAINFFLIMCNLSFVVLRVRTVHFFRGIRQIKLQEVHLSPFLPRSNGRTECMDSKMESNIIVFCHCLLLFASLCPQ